MILSQGFIKVIKLTREQISVTGSANKQITSDYVVWRASFTVRDPDLAKGYKRLAADLDRVKKYLLAKGIAEKELVIPQVNTEQLYKKDEHGNDTNEFMDNRLMQFIEVRSEDVSRITQVSREVTELIDQGVQLNSGAPEYLYRKLDELKLEMLAKNPSQNHSGSDIVGMPRRHLWGKADRTSAGSCPTNCGRKWNRCYPSGGGGRAGAVVDHGCPTAKR